MVSGRTLEFSTSGFSDIVDITSEVQSVVTDSGIGNGIVCVSVTGSTASITTIEYEPALVQDMKDLLERIASVSLRSRHSETWGDDNGFSHLRASLMGPGISLPVIDGKLNVGTWQQVVLIDHDNRSRRRRVHVQVVGEQGQADRT
jgi:secondary thiamine-phosphate synthase enzyme